MSLLQAEDISVRDGATQLLAAVSFHLQPGKPLVVLGETGSGKSLLAQAVMGTLPPELHASGQVTLDHRTLNVNRPQDFCRCWGREMAVLPQEPWLSLDPLMRAGKQIAETHRLVRGLSPGAAQSRSIQDLMDLGLQDAAKHYPHQLSGGMAQRVAIAAARAGGARIVIADEPTKGLDAARRDDVADLLLGEMGDDGGLLVITHDLTLAQRMGGDLLVLKNGHVVETGNTAAVFTAPQASYTRDLLAADPATWSPPQRTLRDGTPVVQTEALAVQRGQQTLFNDLSLTIPAGGIYGVSGPSGCGKSSLGDALLGLIPPMLGRIVRRKGLAPTAFQKLYQDPVAAFPRRQSLGRSLQDVVHIAGSTPQRVDALLARLSLEPVLLKRRPEAVSGGELQRLALLRLLLVQPAFIFADEPTSRLDPITQASVIALLSEIAEQEGVAIMLVSHDPFLIRNTADNVLSLGAQTQSCTLADVPDAFAATCNAS